MHCDSSHCVKARRASPTHRRAVDSRRRTRWWFLTVCVTVVATVKRFYTAASLATRRFAAPMMADDARDRRTTRLIKGVTLSTLLSLIFAPAQECQCPTHYYNQTNRKQRRIAVLGVKHEQRRDDEAAHKQSHRINTRRFIDDHPIRDYSQRKKKFPEHTKAEVIVGMVGE